jgi:hypothetical protein
LFASWALSRIFVNKSHKTANPMNPLSTFRLLPTCALVGVGTLILVLSSCSPQLLQLRPVSGDVAWIEGREVTRVEQNGLVVVASYEFEDQRHIVMDVEIKNRTNAPLTVTPNDFHYLPFGAASDTLPNLINPAFHQVHHAADPEAKIRQATLDMKREKNRLIAMSVLNGVLLVATVASDIKSASKDQNWQRRAGARVAHDQAYNALMQKQAIDINYYHARKDQLTHERSNWQNLALRTTTVAVGESVRGLVFLPKDKRASYLLMNYRSPADSSLVPVKFSQEIVKANP